MDDKMKDKKKRLIVFVIETVVLIALLALLVFIVYKEACLRDQMPEEQDILKPTQSVSPTAAPAPTPTPEIIGLENFRPHAVDSTVPNKLISSTAIMVDGEIVEQYKSQYDIQFDLPEKYTELEGIIGFRGNNFRTGAAYGTVNVTEGKLTTQWTASTGGLSDTDGSYWSGNGWTGQPLIVTWPAETRKNMVAMYDWAREKASLTEVVYAGMDGNVYFYELDSGEYTRDPLDLGFTFKGAGALDPRGYPILYVGAGVDGPNGRSRAFIVNLIDNSVMYEFGHNEPFSNRGWNMFDASPLVSADTDQLIYPGENGVLYIIHLNTRFDRQTGELSVDPDNIVKWKYSGVRTGSAFWVGVESSPAIINHYIYLADNGGNLMCLDLDTLKLVWVQDVLDDTNSTPVVSIEDGKAYLYISTSYHYGWRSYTTANIPIWKIDAETGEIIWQTEYDCYSVDGVSGGVQGTIAVGKNELSDLIFVPIARTPTASAGILAALDKATGEKVWEKETSTYSWSSPVDVYDKDGKGYIVFCNSGYNLYLLDGRTGEELDYMGIGGNVEASPAVYNDYIVVGHRGQRTYCVKIS